MSTLPGVDGGADTPLAQPVQKPVSLELILESVHDVRDEMRLFRDDYDAFKKRVDGSNPPGANGESLAKQAARGSSASFDLEELRGEFLAVRTELKAQSSAMGLSGVLEWFASPNATAKVLRIVGVFTAAYAAAHAAGLVK